MKTNVNHFAGASLLPISFSIALIFAFAILLTAASIATPILGNYPDTTLDLSTDTTVTPDVVPSDTTSINVSTSTGFNGTLTGDPPTGAVQVTDAHPAGTYTVTVTAFSSDGEATSKTFTLTVVTPATCNPVSFGATNFSANDYPWSVAVGDFNGDGKQDLAIPSDTIPGSVSVLLGDGMGRFSDPANFPVPEFPQSVAVGDFNGDGKQDLFIASINPQLVSILLGDGTGNFSAPTSYAVGINPFSVAVADFNGDSRQDLAVGFNYSNKVSILLGDGTGNFSAPADFAAGDSPASVAVGDFNGDGNQDLVAANYISGSVSILLGDGTGHFSDPTNFAAGHTPASVAVGDFNGDGKQDLVVANYNSSNVSIYLGDGSGGFSGPIFFDTYPQPYSVAVGDFDGDGKQDLAIARVNTRFVSILSGDGTGSFSGPMLFSAGSSPDSVAVGDFNGDGKQDLATANAVSGNLSILLRVCAVSQITPAATTCTQFASGTAETLASMQYDVDNNLIERILPRKFLYWVPVTAAAGENVFRIKQAITTGNLTTFFAGVGNASDVFDSGCASLPRSGSQSGDTTTIKFNAPTAGNYFIGVDFSAQSLLGQPVPYRETTAQFEFTTIGVPDSTSRLDLVEH